MPVNNSKLRRDERRSTAAERKAAWDAKTLVQKIEDLEQRGLAHTQQYDRLREQLHKAESV